MVRDSLGSEYVSAVIDDKHFVDFLRDMDEQVAEELSDDSEYEVPHVYEPILNWETLRDRLNFFMSQFNEQVCHR